MSSTSWFNKPQSVTGAQKVRDFYDLVLSEFTERLYKENRFKVNGLDEETVERLEKLAREHLRNPVKLFQKCITMKEGSRLEEVIKNEPSLEKEVPLKIEHVDEKDDYFAVGPPPKPDEKDAHERDEEEYVDDLAEFEEVEQDPVKKQEDKEKRKVEVEVKKEDNYVVEYQSKNPVKAEEQPSESESDKNELSIHECEEYLNCIILGTFSANTLKHKPKEEKTSIDLDNVFIKWHGGDAFLFGKLSVEANKLEKDQIRKEFPYRPKSRSP